MKMTQFRWSSSSGWDIKDRRAIEKANLVLLFADHPYFHTPACYTDLKQIFPQTNLVGCSSAGNVLNTSISDNDIVATAIIFEKGHVKLVAEDIQDNSDVEAIAANMMNKLNDGNLRHVYILSDGLKINGSLLASGFHSVGGNKISVTGGLAGDGTRFSNTWVMADAPARQGRIAAIGFYGDFNINTGCYSGWEEFGAERVVTRSEGNVVYEIDGQPALELYKKYLGKQADELPASGLRFPLSVRSSKESTPIIRTLLAVDELTQSLTFAGDVPKNYLCKLMKTNIDNLIDGAAMAAKVADPGREVISSLCLVVSCVGRRLVLGQLTEEELEIVGERLGDNTSMIGFYSYGELAPFGEMLQCYLHNQTMTLTTIYE